MLMPGTQYLTTYIMSFVASLFPHWMDAYGNPCLRRQVSTIRSPF